VHIAARILGQAAAGEILDSSAVRDLVAGSGTGFEDRGSVELRGVPGTWQLLAIDRHGARAESAEARLASTPTPGPRTAMRRSQHADHKYSDCQPYDWSQSQPVNDEGEAAYRGRSSDCVLAPNR